MMPNVQVVADRFHIMVQVNKELDTQRKREIREVIELTPQNCPKKQQNFKKY